MILFWLFLGLFPNVTIFRAQGKPYLTRYCLLGGSPTDTAHPWLPWNLFLHCFHDSDHSTPHTHPWRWARSLILSGSYLEHRRLFGGRWVVRKFSPGMVNAIDATMSHWVQLRTRRVWTLFLAGPKATGWGFIEGDEFIPAREFIEHQGGTSNTVID